MNDDYVKYKRDVSALLNIFFPAAFHCYKNNHHCDSTVYYYDLVYIFIKIQNFI